MKELVRRVIENRPKGVHVEARYHRRQNTELEIRTGVIERIVADDYAGIGIRVLAEGAWGYAKTSRLQKDAVDKALTDAVKAAKGLAAKIKGRIELAPIKPVTGSYKSIGIDPFANHDMNEWVKIAFDSDKSMLDADDRIKGTMVMIREARNHRIIMNSDGTDVELHDSRPMFYTQAVASEGGNSIPFMLSIGITGGWEIFDIKPPQQMAKKCVEVSLQLLNASMATGGKHTIVMDPKIVGDVAHEAFGHTVESDFVLAGSATKDKIGEQVADESVTIVDSGEQEYASGWLAVDDAGVEAKKTVIIDSGILKSYLHSRASAHHFGVEPTGNERAFEYDVEPIIRMRNTYLEPGDFSREEIIEDVKFGYLLVTSGGGRADSSGAFMFDMFEAYEINKGEIGNIVRNVSVSGNAFEVLSSVDAIGSDWKLDSGAGHCGKGQLARVDGGGGTTRAVALISGETGGV